MESSGMWYNIYECLNKRHIDVRLSNPTKTGAIASAKIGTDKLDAVKLWIKKATGLGITEFMLRYMAWPCLRNKNLEGTQMCIVTDPRIDLAITLIDRMKRQA